MTDVHFPILLRHDEHGATHVYTPAELEERLQKGWKQVAALLKEPVVEQPEKRKPGRPRKAE